MKKNILLLMLITAMVPKSIFAMDDADWKTLVTAAYEGNPENFPNNNNIINKEGDNFLNIQKFKKITPLLAAIYSQKESSEVTRELLKKYSGVIDLNALVNGLTPLMHAVNEGNPELVKLLLDQGVKTDVTATSAENSGDTALHLAVRNGSPTIVKLLTDYLRDNGLLDANLTAKLSGKTPLEIARQEGHQNIESMLGLTAEREEYFTKRLIQAIIAGDKTVTDKLLDDGRANIIRYLDPAQHEVAGAKFPLNALNAAALTENKELLSSLLEKGAQINSKDKLGNTLLHNVVTYGTPAIISFLIEKGADVNIPNNEKQTVIPAALRREGATDAGALTFITPLLAANNVNLEDETAQIAIALGFNGVAKAIRDVIAAKKSVPAGDGGGAGSKPVVDPKELQDSLSALANKLSELENSLKAKVIPAS